MRLAIALLFCAACSNEGRTPATTAPAKKHDAALAPAPGPSPPPNDGAVVEPKPPPSGDTLVDIESLDDTIGLDIRYATENNFTRVAVYPLARCLLRYDVAIRLVKVQAALVQGAGYGLKVWDCYRPISVQQKFWALVPDSRYVARPVIENGKPIKGSKHNRGAAVDLTLVDAAGKEVEMPTDYDDFSHKAHRDHAGATDAARRHRQILEDAMKQQGFEPLPTEWWHFDGPNWKSYPLSDEPLE